MLTVTGSIVRNKSFPGEPARLRELFLDLPALLGNVAMVDSVEKYDGGVYRIIMKKIGALNFFLWLAADVQMTEYDDRIEARTLPYDPHDAWIGEGVLLYDYASMTRLTPNGGDSTHVDHSVDVKVHVPLPAFLEKLPIGMVKGAADSLMTQNIARLLDDMEASAHKLIARA
ncbi:MAG: DUF1997 domain-containing protein [Candidatus Sericytochromatia bacterium]|uniref:DUF1997 domain-containing protein n=1 Tax=Candidatus Tanganyikabacteria bacterium TaxID=2961651 RepID=A0A938BMI8_9BACT|nr:DUF1997 domain-containing protein [Candidatus Tanganyikabacteria bacterium]